MFGAKICFAAGRHGFGTWQNNSITCTPFTGMWWTSFDADMCVTSGIRNTSSFIRRSTRLLTRNHVQRGRCTALLQAVLLALQVAIPLQVESEPVPSNLSSSARSLPRRLQLHQPSLAQWDPLTCPNALEQFLAFLHNSRGAHAQPCIRNPRELLTSECPAFAVVEVCCR